MKISLNVKLGVVAGLLNCLAWYGIAKGLNYYSLAVEQYRYLVTLFLLLSGVLVSIIYERKQQSGFISFKEAAKCGILYTLVLALLLAVFNYIYYSVLVPDAVDYFLSEARKQMTLKKYSENDILKSLDVIKSYFGSFRMFMSTVILGTIMSLIAGALFRKKNTPDFIGAN